MVDANIEVQMKEQGEMRENQVAVCPDIRICWESVKLTCCGCDGSEGKTVSGGVILFVNLDEENEFQFSSIYLKLTV